MSVVQKSKGGLDRRTYEKISLMYLDHLCDQDLFEEAAKKCVTVIGDNQQTWEHYFFKFKEHGKVKVSNTTK